MLPPPTGSKGPPFCPASITVWSAELKERSWATAGKKGQQAHSNRSKRKPGSSRDLRETSLAPRNSGWPVKQTGHVMGVPQSGRANGVTGSALPGIANACGPHPFRGRKSSVFQGFSKNAQKPAGASRASGPRPQQKLYCAPWRLLSAGSCLRLCFESVIYHKPPTSNP